MKKILATSWHPGGANAISPVIKSLREKDDVEVVAIGYQYSEKVFERDGVEYRKISDYGLKDVALDSMFELLEMESPDLIVTGTSVQVGIIET